MVPDDQCGHPWLCGAQHSQPQKLLLVVSLPSSHGQNVHSSQDLKDDQRVEGSDRQQDQRQLERCFDRVHPLDL